MGTSPRQVLRTEEQAIQKLNGLAQTDGCGTATSFSGVMVVNGIIGPAEIAASPSLVAFGNPAYQGLEQSSFSRLGPGLGLGIAPLPANFGAGSTNGSTWAFQLLAIMLLVALGGFYKFIPVVAARLRQRTHPLETPFDFESLGRMSELELDRARDGELPSKREREKIAA